MSNERTSDDWNVLSRSNAIFARDQALSNPASVASRLREPAADSGTSLPSAEAMSARHMAACGLNQPVDRSRISRALEIWASEVNAPPHVGFVESERELLKVAQTAKLAVAPWTEAYRQASTLAFTAPNDLVARLDRSAAALRAARSAHAEAKFRPDGRWWRSRGTGWDVPFLAIAAITAASRGDVAAARRWLPLIKALEAGCFWLWIDDAAIHVGERPTVSLDRAGRLHCPNGPAFVWLSDLRSHYWHGVRVPVFVVERPSSISLDVIHAEANVEIRRVMIERYRCAEEIAGPAAYMRDAGGTRIDHDERFGTLWRCDLSGDEPLLMIEVVNATREADGGFKRYWLRVPPNTKTAREAAAWTFAMPPDQYKPRIET
jgi:hypothetical protein